MNKDYSKEIEKLPRYRELSPSERAELVEQPDALWQADYAFFRETNDDEPARAAEKADINRQNRDIARKRREQDKSSETQRSAALAFNPRLIDIDKAHLSEGDARAIASSLSKLFPGAALSEQQFIEGGSACLKSAAANYNAAAKLSGGSIEKFLRFAFECIAIDEWKGALAGREKRLALERRVDLIEQSIADFGDKGVWKDGVYRKNNWVTFGGSLWVAQCDTDRKPGESRDWRLAVKRGQDGKDADPAHIAKHLLPEVLRKIDSAGR